MTTHIGALENEHLEDKVYPEEVLQYIGRLILQDIASKPAKHRESYDGLYIESAPYYDGLTVLIGGRKWSIEIHEDWE